MNNFLLQKAFTEHHKFPYGEDVSDLFDKSPGPICFLNRKNSFCVQFKQNSSGVYLHTSYYIGVDWIITDSVPIYVAPKLNDGNAQVDYLKMLFNALRHSEIAKDANELFEIKFDEPYIEIQQQQDLLTPLLVVHFLRIVREIVRKGLKKSYYKIEQNLNEKIKGKVLVSKTIKHNLFKNKQLATICCYDEFGLNGPENRLLKKTLKFVLRYMSVFNVQDFLKYANEELSFILPSFEYISDDVSVNDIKHNKSNVFYKEYKEAINLAKLILKRFGYNINNIHKNGKLKTPPFWIDMSKLFELYVLGLLKDSFGNGIEFQFPANYGNPDYLFPARKLIIDAKYKTYYEENFKGQTPWKREQIAKDIRQLSGYARDKKVLERLGNGNRDAVQCLIIYPYKGPENQADTCLITLEIENKKEIQEFDGFYKLAVKLPVIKTN